MPYTIKKVKNGYKVCLKSDPSQCFSKKPLSEGQAEKQKVAIEISEGSGKFDKFHDQLAKQGIKEKDYLNAAKASAKREGYDSDKIYLAEDNDHKLLYDGPNGLRQFGKVGYSDYIIYSLSPNFKKEYADEQRMKYHKRFNKSALYENDSPSLLILRILW